MILVEPFLMTNSIIMDRAATADTTKKYRRTGIVTTAGNPFSDTRVSSSNSNIRLEDDVQFPCVGKLIEKYSALILKQQQQGSIPLSANDDHSRSVNDVDVEEDRILPDGKEIADNGSCLPKSNIEQLTVPSSRKKYRNATAAGDAAGRCRGDSDKNNDDNDDDDDKAQKNSPKSRIKYSLQSKRRQVTRESSFISTENSAAAAAESQNKICYDDDDNTNRNDGNDDEDRTVDGFAPAERSPPYRRKMIGMHRSPSQEAFFLVGGERRQTWTGPLNNGGGSSNSAFELASDPNGTDRRNDNNNNGKSMIQKLAVRKTCSYDQALKKHHQINSNNNSGHLKSNLIASSSRGRKGSDTIAGGYYYYCSNNTSVEDETDNNCNSRNYYNNNNNHLISRTPSVIISDHSDNPSFASSTMTLEEMEFHQRRQQRCLAEYDWNNSSSPLGCVDSSSDCSLASSWSVGNGCINILEDDYEIQSYERRKISASSSCSTFSSFEDDDINEDLLPSSSTTPPDHHHDAEEDAVATVQSTKKPSGWRKLRSIVQWTPFFQTYKKQRYPWVQLAGHQGNFRAGREPGTILKKLCLKEEMCFQLLMKDILKPFVPEYKGSIKTEDEERYLQLQDLLSEFSAPCVMDCKIGVRTYLEEELAKAKEKPKLRKDMYEKMIQIDPNAPSDEEHRLKGVTKPRYMVWRETISSTATLGFRIEGIRKSDGKSSKDFKTTKTRDQIMEAFRDFVDGFPEVVAKYIRRLNAIKDTLEYSKFFATHEVIGSSLLFVHDKNNASVWLIDFAKTVVLPPDVQINHASEWIVGNHEDGFLIGLNNLIDVFGDLLPPPSSSSSSSSSTNISGSASSVISSAPTDAAAAIRKSASVLPSTVELNSSAIDVT